ncbi:MAG: hypothetical protein E7Z96_00260 [Actinomycetaceae bacterium]|nr:hypothetical protein [Actinomycetaceae bacterium]
MKVLQIALGVLGGLLVGMLATVVHSGPVDLPVVGLVLATGLVASGTWFLLEWKKPYVWLGYAPGVIGATIWLLMFPPVNDSVLSVDQWVSQLWLILAPVAALVPSLLLAYRRPDSTSGEKAAD